MRKPCFTLKSLIVIVAVLALGLGWWRDRSQLAIRAESAEQIIADDRLLTRLIRENEALKSQAFKHRMDLARIKSQVKSEAGIASLREWLTGRTDIVD